MVCIILPVLNEEEGLKEILPQLNKYEIVVLDGRSTDNSVKIAKKIGAKIIIQQTKGKGNAFQEFLQKYSGKQKKFVMLDADGTYDPKEIPVFVKLLDKCDVVMGERTFLPGAQSILHKFGNSFLTFCANLLYGKRLNDLCTGYWGFTKKFLEKANIIAPGFDLEANLFSEAVKNNFTICSYKIKLRKRRGEKKLMWTHGFRILYFLVKNRFF